jgi:glycosyltransferase involved in cell wall biosynthesis
VEDVRDHGIFHNDPRKGRKGMDVPISHVRQVMTARRRLLFLSPIVPARSGNGLAMRTGFFLDAYAREFDIDLAVFPVSGARVEAGDFLRERTERLSVFPLPPADAHFSLIAAMIDPAARLSAFRQYGRPSLTSRLGAVAQSTLESWIGERRYDAVHVERLYLAPLVERWTSMPRESRPQLMIDSDDDDSTTFRRLADRARRDGRFHAAEWAQAEADAFLAMAQRALPKFDLVFAASATDAASISSYAATASVVPNVIPAGIAPVRKPRRSRSKTILFVGNMSYTPNADGARWFLNRVWPRLRRASRSPLRLVIAGSNPPQSLARTGKQRDVRVTAWVPDLAPCYRAADLVVVPIRVGGGTRIKLIEAAAHGLPIVSTTLGAEGTAFRHGRDLLLADTEERFVEACAGLLANPVRAARFGRRARVTAARAYDRERWSRQLADCAANLQCLSGARSIDAENL